MNAGPRRRPLVLRSTLQAVICKLCLYTTAAAVPWVPGAVGRHSWCKLRPQGRAEALEPAFNWGVWGPT